MNDTYWTLLMVFVAMPLSLFAGIVMGKGIAALDDEKDRR